MYSEDRNLTVTSYNYVVDTAPVYRYTDGEGPEYKLMGVYTLSLGVYVPNP